MLANEEVLMFSKEQLAEISKQQGRDVAMTSMFLKSMGYTNPEQKVAYGVTYGAQLDSMNAQAAETQQPKTSYMPDSLITMEKALAGTNQFKHLLDSIGFGIEAYRNRNGGDYPRTATVAAALSEAALLFDGLNANNTEGLYDSAKMLDSVSSGAHTHIAEVPALAMVTIATTIANASPLVAYLPNPKGTQSVPLVYVRQIAKNSYGQMSKQEFLDGAKAGAQYFDAVHRFEMTSADQTTFTVKAYRSVQPGTFTPDDQSGRLPIVLGASLINIAGIPVASDELSQAKAGGSVTGTYPINGLDHNGFKYKGVTYKVTQGSVNLDTDTITFTLDKALPADTSVIVNTVANYEAKDNNNQYILTAPSVDVSLDYSTIHAYGIRAIYQATIDSITQMQNELGIDQRSAFVAVVIAKLMLEQNVRLLSGAKERAIGQGIERAVDLTRGSDMTAAFNKTADIAAEMLPAIDEIKRRIVERTSHVPSGYDIYVTGSMSTMVKTLADDTNFVPSGLTLGAPNNIVRIGSRGTDNYYYLPSTLNILEEGEEDVGGVSVTFGEVLIVARNAEAAKSVFVGHIAVPVVTDDVKAVPFEKGVTFYTRQACEANKNERFGGQVGLLRVLNLPKSLTTEV